MEGAGYLVRQPLLYLQPPAECPGDLLCQAVRQMSPGWSWHAQDLQTCVLLAAQCRIKNAHGDGQLRSMHLQQA